jgi:prepilin-type N-terminal cleavage/methylation domain-containing protein
MCKLRRVLRLLRQQDGMTLSELVTTMTILLIVLATLTTVFIAAGNAESQQTRRLQAQQEARVALVRMRKELHCATAISAGGGAVATVTATLPALCFGGTGPDVAVTYQTVSVSTGRWRLERVQGASTVMLADYLTSATAFTYSPPTTSTKGSLRVDLRVDLDPTGGPGVWNLVDDVVLRNTARL